MPQSNDRLSLELMKRQVASLRAENADLKNGDGGGTSGGMSHDTQDLSVRIARLEGGNTTMQWATALISAALLAAMAIIVGLQLQTRTDVAALNSKVDALPGEINANLLALTSTLSQTITAARLQPQPAASAPSAQPDQTEMTPTP